MTPISVLRSRRRNRELRLAARSHPCTHCGGAYPVRSISLHHLWPALDMHPRLRNSASAGLSKIQSVRQLRRELKKVIPLCRMCHHVRHLTVAEAGFHYGRKQWK